MKLLPVKIVKISSNDGAALIYLPKEIREMGFVKGEKVMLSINEEDSKQMLVERLPRLPEEVSHE